MLNAKHVSLLKMMKNHVDWNVGKFPDREDKYYKLHKRLFKGVMKIIQHYDGP